MPKKKKLLTLAQLAKDSDQLPAMLAELSGKPDFRLDGVKSRWSERFAASGKNRCAIAPRIRLE